jgi:hypothetical protein
MDEDVFSIIRAAITIAKNERLETVNALRGRLNLMFDGKEAQIEEAIKHIASENATQHFGRKIKG